MADTTVISLFTNIANAIRKKTGRSDSIVADDFPSVLASVPDNSLFVSILNKTVTNIPESYLEGLTSIGHYAFYNCPRLALTSLPEGLTSIDDRAFDNCLKLALTSLPEGLTSIGSAAFSRCTNLTTLTFKGTPTSVSSSAFSYCYNLTTINVPWAEGAVAGAPWGATDATINYNYTGG